MSDSITQTSGRAWPPIRVATIGLALGLVALAVWAAPSAVQAGDAGELSTVMLRGGVPHPSGYPWMRALGPIARLLEQLGVAPARAAALPCALCGAAAWVVLLGPVSRLVSWKVATWAVAFMGTASIVVLHAFDAEVWGLHLLLCACFVRLALRDPPCSPLRLGLMLGLAVSHHLSAVLLVPLAIGAALPAREPGGDARRWAMSALRAGGLGLAGSALGLLAYATLMIGDGGAWRWGDTQSLSGLLHHVSRGDYGVLSLSLHEDTVGPVDQLRRVAASLGRVLSAGRSDAPWLGAGLLVAVALGGATRVPTALRPAAWRGYLAATALSTFGFPALHDIDPASPFGAWILERFDLLPCLLWTPLVALAAARATEALRGRVSSRVVPAALAALGAGAILAQLATTADRGVPSDDDGVERYAVDLLRTPAPGVPSLVFGTGDHRTFGVLYAQEVLEEGEHVLYIDASLLAHAWYRARLRDRWPQLPDVDKPLALMGAVWRSPALADTPVYLANDFSRPSTTLGRVPEGLLWRVIPPPELATTPPPSPAEVLARHRAAWSRYVGPPPGRPKAGHPFTGDLAANYTDLTERLIEALRAAGMTDDARDLAHDLASR